MGHLKAVNKTVLVENSFLIGSRGNFLSKLFTCASEGNCLFLRIVKHYVELSNSNDEHDNGFASL